VATAETQRQQEIEPLNNKVATPYQEKILQNEFEASLVDSEQKISGQEVATSCLEESQNSCTVDDSAVATSLVATPPVEKSEDELPGGTLVESTSTHPDRKNLKGVQLTVIGVSQRHPRCSAYDSISCQLPDGTTKDFARHSLKRV
jgi:hypothetical protein